MTVLALVDVLLLAGLTARLSRLVVADDVGLWFVKRPARRWALRPVLGPNYTHGGWWQIQDTDDTMSSLLRNHPGAVRRIHLVSGLDCPYCVGFWIAAAMVSIVALFDGPGHMPDWWRYLAGAFTLNYVVAHTGARLGDTAGDDE